MYSSSLSSPSSLGYSFSCSAHFLRAAREHGVLRFQDGIRAPPPFSRILIIILALLKLSHICTTTRTQPQANTPPMAAPANMQLSLQIHHSLQPQAQAQQISPSPTTSDFSEVSISLASTSQPLESFGPPAPSLLPPPDVQAQFSGISSPSSSRSSSQFMIAHPYARLYAKKNATGAKRRKIWNHALEKSVFTAHEMFVDVINGTATQSLTR